MHVFRGPEWFDAEPISFTDWSGVVASSPELRMTGFVEAATSAGETIRMEHDGLAEWTGHSSGGAIPLLFDGARSSRIRTAKLLSGLPPLRSGLTPACRAMTASSTSSFQLPIRPTGPDADGFAGGIGTRTRHGARTQ